MCIHKQRQSIKLKCFTNNLIFRGIVVECYGVSWQLLRVGRQKGRVQCDSSQRTRLDLELVNQFGDLKMSASLAGMAQ